MSTLSLTKKQRWILLELIKGECSEGQRLGDLDLDQLIEALSNNTGYPNYSPTKQALQYSLRYLIKKGLVEKGELTPRRGKQRRILMATSTAHFMCQSMSSGAAVSEIVSEGFEDCENFHLD